MAKTPKSFGSSECKRAYKDDSQGLLNSYSPKKNQECQYTLLNKNSMECGVLPVSIMPQNRAKCQNSTKVYAGDNKDT